MAIAEGTRPGNEGPPDRMSTEMDKCCENCKWWGVDNFPTDLGCRLPDNMGPGFALCGRAKFASRYGKRMDEPMTVIDGEGYSADLITRKDHYCSAWEVEK